MLMVIGSQSHETLVRYLSVVQSLQFQNPFNIPLAFSKRVQRKEDYKQLLGIKHDCILNKGRFMIFSSVNYLRDRRSCLGGNVCQCERTCYLTLFYINKNVVFYIFGNEKSLSLLGHSKCWIKYIKFIKYFRTSFYLQISFLEESSQKQKNQPK